MNRLGDIEFTRKHYPAALAYFEQSLRLREAGLGGTHALVSRSLQRVGSVYLALNRLTEAEDFVGRAVLGFEKLPVKAELGIALGYLRNIYLLMDRLDDATSAARREVKVYEALGDSKGISNAKVGLSAVLLREAQNLVGRNNYADAEKVLVRAIQPIDPPPPGGENAFSALQAQLGHVYERQRRYAEAAPRA
jgi:tetratricopeptide (TPR) repeat protein